MNALQPHVKVIEASHGDVSVDDILNTSRFDFETVFASAAWVSHIENMEEEDNDEGDEHHHEGEHGHEHHHDEAHEHHDEGHEHHEEEHDHGHHHHHEHNHEGAEEDEYGIGNFVYYRRRPFNRERLEAFAAKWPRNIIRCKGVMWFSDERDMAYVFETSGRQIVAGASGQWVATCSKKEQEKILAKDSKLRAEWDETYGDRMIKLCIIGQKLDKEQIATDLDSVLDD